MKVLITGAKGMLGTDLIKVLSREHEVIGVDIDDFDITDLTQSKSFIMQIVPDIVIHAAAYTDVDGSEKCADVAFRVNAIGTQNIALACQVLDIPMLYISTDFIFDGGKNQPYVEWDKPNPLAAYGASKLAGERYVTSLLNKFYIVRIAWLYGAHGKNFVYTILRLANEGQTLRIVDDQIGSPTYTLDVANGIFELIRTERYGIYHMVNHGAISWYGFAKKILELSGLEDVIVKPITSDEIDRPARRPAYSVLRNKVLELTIGDPMRDWESALEDFISHNILKRSS